MCVVEHLLHGKRHQQDLLQNAEYVYQNCVCVYCEWIPDGMQRSEVNTKQIKCTTDGEQRKKYGRKIRTKKERKVRNKK